MMRIIISNFLFVYLVTVNAQVTTQTTTPYFPSLHNTDPSFTPVVVAIACSFLFVLFFAFYLRQCSDANLTVPSLPVAATAAGNYTTHHEYQGIDSKLLDTFPTLMYSDLKEIKLGGGTTNIPLDCAVCLSEFKHDDILRLLPKCNHVFHPDCIKTWLASHVTCPVCREVLTPAERRHGKEEEEEVAVVIQNNEMNEPEEIGDRPARRTMTTTTTTMRVVSCGGERGLRRCHSTGHSLDLSSPTKYEVFEGREDEGSSRGRLFISE